MRQDCRHTSFTQVDTAKPLNNIAQGRAAHPGSRMNGESQTPKGFNIQRLVEPLRGSAEVLIRYFPGCAARSWALLLKSFGLDSHSFKTLTRLAVCNLLTIAILLTVTSSTHADDQPIATAAVKQLPAANPNPQPPVSGVMMASPATPPAMLPAERFPQYRIGYRRSDAAIQSLADDRKIRFVLTNPSIIDQVGRPLLIEATVNIDGQSFSKIRKTQANALIAASTKPETEAAESENVEQKTPIEAIPETSLPKDNDQATEPDASKSEDEKEDAEKDEKEKPPVTPATVSIYAPSNHPADMMRRYAAAVGENLDESEASWLMTHWTDGPSLLVVHPYFQSFRAEQRPAFDVLDRDRDGIVSSKELDEAADSFRKCDANRDDVVDVLEISKASDAARDPASYADATGPLFWLLPDMVGIQQSDPLLYGGLRFFDADQDGQLQPSEIAALADKSPDIELTVEFNSQSAEASRLNITRIANALHAKVGVSATTAGLDVLIGALAINFCGLQEPSGDAKNGQISLGAIVDGYPLLPLLDPNDDGRFTIRELRTLRMRLSEFDRDGDGSLTKSETQSPIRVCLGLGGIVHYELANIRSIRRESLPETILGPEWFVRLDRNRDNDLARGEFPGTDEQFNALDADGDQLVSASEAHKFDNEQQSDK